MKAFFTACILSCLALTQTFAQAKRDSDFKFDQSFTKCELKWVVIPPKTNAPKGQYAYGFVYVDMMAGYTIDIKGILTIDAKGHYVPDTAISQNRALKFRLAGNTAKLALLPPEHFAELHIQPRPAWVDVYYRGRDTTTTPYNLQMGFILNGAGDSQAALTYLNKAYATDPDFKGLAFEMGYAYNALNRYDDAVKFLQAALKADPKNTMLFRELGYAYKSKGALDDAINYYTQGIALCTDAQNESKAEMGYNLAYVYKAKGDYNAFKDMMTKVKMWAPVNSQIYRAVLQQNL